MKYQHPTPRLCQLSLALVAAGCISLPAAGQTSDSSAQLPTVTVTGSNIKRLDAVTDSPVQVITRSDIARTGATTVRELIDTLASATGSLSDIGGSNSFSPGASSANLRNLGKQSTLILLNFRRVAPAALADYNEVFTNLDALPLGVIDRIEVLKNGAAAIYGSDAVAGVINIITRNDYQGVNLQASHEQSISSGRLGSSTAAITAGRGNLATDRYNIIANVEVYHRDPLIWGDVLGYVNPDIVAAGKSSGFGTTSSYSYPGNVQQPDGSLKAAAGCDPKLIVNGLCRYDRYSRFQAVPQSDRLSLFSAGKLALSNDVTAFAEVNYSHIRVPYVSAFQTYGPASSPTTWGDPKTLQPKTFTYYGLPAGNSYNPSGQDDANFRYRFVDGDSGQLVKSDQYRLVTGLTGNTGAWDWEAAVGYMGSKTSDDIHGAFSDSGFKSVIGDYTQLNADGYPSDPQFFNRGYKLGQVNSAAVLNTLFPSFGFSGKYDQSFLDAKASRAIFKLPAGDVQFAGGVELRHEKFTITPTQNLATGDIVGYGTSATDASRTFSAIYSELRIPVVKTLEASLAARYDKYPGFSGNLSPKLGMRWQPSAELVIRSTVETGFRAPNLTESANSTKFAFSPGVSDPARCPQASALSQALTAQANALPDSDPNKSLLVARAEQVQSNECSAGLASIVTNNPSLQPEKSRSFSAGIVFEPVKGYSGSVDYWNIHRNNEIGLLDINKLLADEGNLPAGNTISRRSPGSPDPTFSAAELQTYGVNKTALLASQQSFVNTTKTKTSGVDIGLQADAKLPPGWGSLGFRADAAYLIEYKKFSESLGDYGDNLAGRYGYSRLKLNATGTWKYGNFETSLRANFSSGTKLQADYDDVTYSVQGCSDNFGFTESECRVAGYTTWDLALSFTGVKNLTLGAGIKNIFATKPAADRRALVESGGFIIPQDVGDVRGRMLRVAAEYQF